MRRLLGPCTGAAVLLSLLACQAAAPAPELRGLLAANGATQSQVVHCSQDSGGQELRLAGANLVGLPDDALAGEISVPAPVVRLVGPTAVTLKLLAVELGVLTVQLPSDEASLPRGSYALEVTTSAGTGRLGGAVKLLTTPYVTESAPIGAVPGWGWADAPLCNLVSHRVRLRGHGLASVGTSPMPRHSESLVSATDTELVFDVPKGDSGPLLDGLASAEGCAIVKAWAQFEGPTLTACAGPSPVDVVPSALPQGADAEVAVLVPYPTPSTSPLRHGLSAVLLPSAADGSGAREAAFVRVSWDWGNNTSFAGVHLRIPVCGAAAGCADGLALGNWQLQLDLGDQVVTASIAITPPLRVDPPSETVWPGAVFRLHGAGFAAAPPAQGGVRAYAIFGDGYGAPGSSGPAGPGSSACPLPATVIDDATLEVTPGALAGPCVAENWSSLPAPLLLARSSSDGARAVRVVRSDGTRAQAEATFAASTPLPRPQQSFQPDTRPGAVLETPDGPLLLGIGSSGSGYACVSGTPIDALGSVIDCDSSNCNSFAYCQPDPLLPHVGPLAVFTAADGTQWVLTVPADSTDVLAAPLLEPRDAPTLGDASPALPLGSPAGVSQYRVSALKGPGDALDPGGESLASPPLQLVGPLNAHLRWRCVKGAIGYYLLRSTSSTHWALAQLVTAADCETAEADWQPGGAQYRYVKGRGATGRMRQVGKLAVARSFLTSIFARPDALYVVGGGFGSAEIPVERLPFLGSGASLGPSENLGTTGALAVAALVDSTNSSAPPGQAFVIATYSGNSSDQLGTWVVDLGDSRSVRRLYNYVPMDPNFQHGLAVVDGTAWVGRGLRLCAAPGCTLDSTAAFGFIDMGVLAKGDGHGPVYRRTSYGYSFLGLTDF